MLLQLEKVINLVATLLPFSILNSLLVFVPDMLFGYTTMCKRIVLIFVELITYDCSLEVFHSLWVKSTSLVCLNLGMSSLKVPPPLFANLFP